MIVLSFDLDNQSNFNVELSPNHKRRLLVLMNTKEKKGRLVLTKKNVEQLKAELKELIHSKRKKIIAELKVARAQGDLSENAEYDVAKQKQVELEARIARIQFLLKNSEIAEEKEKDVVAIGKVVTLLDLKSDAEMSFQIGTFFDIDVEKNIISNNSPLAKSIIGSKVGEQTLIKGRAGQPSYWVKIIKISDSFTS